MKASEYFPDGLLLLDDIGRVIVVGNYEDVQSRFKIGNLKVIPKGKLIVPGFIDCHVHAPQIDSKKHPV